jgi:hypothetical protein
MWDFMLVVPMAVGALMIAILLLELGLGKIGFLTKNLGIQYDQAKQRFELSTGPVFGIFVIGAALVIAPLVIDHFLVTKKTFFLSGKVQIEDGSSPRAVRVIACYPLTDVLDDGAFFDVRLYKDETGKFPQVAFELPGFSTKRLPITDDTVRKVGSNLALKEDILLSKKPTD